MLGLLGLFSSTSYPTIDTVVGLLGFALGISIPVSAGATNYPVLTVAICLPLFTHWAGTRYRTGYKFYSPFAGGIAHIVLQVLGWACYGLFLIAITVGLVVTALDGTAAFPVTLGHQRITESDQTGPLALWLPGPDLTDSQVLKTLGALSQLFVVSSLCVYNPDQSLPVVPLWGHGSVACTVLISISWVMCLIADLVKGGCLPWLGPGDSEQDTDIPGRSTSLSTGIAWAGTVLWALVVPATHYIGKFKAHYAAVPERGLQKQESFRLWQPFQGGSHFMALQAAGWVLYAASLMLTVVRLALQWAGVVRIAAGYFTAVASVAVVSQMLVMSSLFFFRRRALPMYERLTLWCNLSVVILICSGSAIPFSILAESESLLRTSLALRVLSTAGFGVAVPLTHNLARRLKAQTGRASFWAGLEHGDRRMYRRLRVVGGALYSLSIVCTCWSSHSYYHGLLPVPGLIFFGAAFGFVSHLVVLAYYSKQFSEAGQGRNATKRSVTEFAFCMSLARLRDSPEAVSDELEMRGPARSDVMTDPDKPVPSLQCWTPDVTQSVAAFILPSS